LISGLVGLVIVTGLSFTPGDPIKEIFKNSPFVFLAMPAIGLLCGELHRQSAGRREELETQNALLKETKEAFEKDLELARESQYLLQRELSLQGADVCSLDVELRKIFDEGAAPVLQGTLGALAQVSGVTDAAFYLLGENDEELKLEESIGDAAFFPDIIGKKHTKMAWTAIEEGELVTCQGLGEGKGDIGRARFLAAVPWRSGEKIIGVLLIHDMPFLAMNWQTLARIELVCDWVAVMQGVREKLGGETATAMAGQDEFMSMLGSVGKSVKNHGLPSAVAVLTAVGTLSASELRRAIAAEIRPTDVAAEVADNGLAVLLPLEAGRDAQNTALRFEAAVGERASLTLLTISEDVPAEAMWEAIGSSVGEA